MSSLFKEKENGFAALEVMVAMGIASVVFGIAYMTYLPIFNDTRQTNDHFTALNSANNAAFWIARDAAMADTVDTTGLTAPTFLVLRWTEWGFGSASVFHTVTYSIENVSGGIGTLKRRHQVSTGSDTTTRIADNIYYDTSDASGTSSVSLNGTLLSLKIVSDFGAASEVREIQVRPRPNFNIR